MTVTELEAEIMQNYETAKREAVESLDRLEAKRKDLICVRSQYEYTQSLHQQAIAKLRNAEDVVRRAGIEI